MQTTLQWYKRGSRSQRTTRKVERYVQQTLTESKLGKDRGIVGGAELDIPCILYTRVKQNVGMSIQTPKFTGGLQQGQTFGGKLKG